MEISAAEAGSDVCDLHVGVGVHRAAFGPRDSLNSCLPGQRATAAVEAQAALHRVAACTEPQRTLEK